MYRQSYTEQPMPQNINTSLNQPQIGNYDYRGSTIHYNSSDNRDSNMMQSLPPMHQPLPMYYENQSVPPPPPIDQNPYLSMMAGQQSVDPNEYFSRYYWRQMQPKNMDSYSMPPQNTQYVPPPPPPPPNVVQRISSLIKSQLPLLQAIMVKVSSNYVSHQESRRQHQKSSSRSRSRSRSKQRRRKSSDSSQDWLCRKCSFSNYDWRETCKKCYEARPPRNFVPGPEDWKCTKCGNINYARRMECNRCKRSKNGND